MAARAVIYTALGFFIAVLAHFFFSLLMGIVVYTDSTVTNMSQQAGLQLDQNILSWKDTIYGLIFSAWKYYMLASVFGFLIGIIVDAMRRRPEEW